MKTLAWYLDNVNHFSIETGLIPSLFVELKLQGLTRVLFLKALNKISEVYAAIRSERARAEIERMRNG